MSDKPRFTESEIRVAITEPSTLVSLESANDLQAQEAKLHDFLKTSPTTKLSALISQCIEIVDLCDPSKTLKSQNWMVIKVREFVGSELATKVSYHASVSELDGLLEQAKEQARLITGAFKDITKLIDNLNAKAAELTNNLALGELIVEHHLERVAEPERPFLKKRVANLGALISANDMAIEQFKLAQKNALTVVHRFEEMETMVLPSWKSLAMQRSMTQEFTPEQGAKVKAIYANVKQDLNELNQLLS